MGRPWCGLWLLKKAPRRKPRAGKGVRRKLRYIHVQGGGDIVFDLDDGEDDPEKVA